MGTGNNDNRWIGDKVPVTTGGRIIGVFIMFFGVALLSLFTATISSIFVARQIKEGRGLEQIKFKDHLIICGWNFNGEQILESLQKKKKKISVVLINHLSEEAIADITNQFPRIKISFVKGDYTKETVLNRANVKAANSVIIIPDNSAGLGVKSDERTILATLSIKALSSSVKVYAHILDRENLSHIRKAKVDDVSISDAYTGYLLAAHILTPGIPQTVNKLFMEDGTYQFNRQEAPTDFIGKSYGSLRDAIQNKQNAVLIGIGRGEEGVNISDILSDDYSFLDQFIKRKFEEAGRGIHNEQKINIQINSLADTILTEKDFLILISNGDNK